MIDDISYISSTAEVNFSLPYQQYIYLYLFSKHCRFLCWSFHSCDWSLALCPQIDGDGNSSIGLGGTLETSHILFVQMMLTTLPLSFPSAQTHVLSTHTRHRPNDY